MIGEKLEQLGWRQGSVVKKSDVPDLLAFVYGESDPDIHLIVATQSCDIATSNIILDPNIELSIARSIKEKKGNLTFNKNPRQLHTELKVFTADKNLFSNESIEINIAEQIKLPKKYLVNFSPDDAIQLENHQLESYVNWLSARYSRPALPTAFNNKIARADPKGKLRKKAKILNEKMTGIYVEINPFRELVEGENYSVNLLGLVSESNERDIPQAKNSLSSIAEILKAAQMDVKIAVRSEASISVAQIKRFKRFYFDDLSVKEGADLPPEVITNL